MLGCAARKWLPRSGRQSSRWATVGYGDVVPHTGWGRVIGCVVIIFGVTFITFLTAVVTSLFVEAEQEEHRQRAGDSRRLRMTRRAACCRTSLTVCRQWRPCYRGRWRWACPARDGCRVRVALRALAVDDLAGGLALDVAVSPVAWHECSVAPKVGAHVLILDVPGCVDLAEASCGVARD